MLAERVLSVQPGCVGLGAGGGLTLAWKSRHSRASFPPETWGTGWLSKKRQLLLGGENTPLASEKPAVNSPVDYFKANVQLLLQTVFLAVSV